jgi:hypothetical protein
VNEICMRCNCTNDEHQIYHFESGCWCTKCIDYVMANSHQWLAWAQIYHANIAEMFLNNGMQFKPD